MKTLQKVPVETLHLFQLLDELLVDLLKSLHPEEWQLPTIAKLWTVKDIASHLLDGNLRGLSGSRDNFSMPPPNGIKSYDDLVGYLNQLNADWVLASKRLSPAVLIQLLAVTNMEYSAHLSTIDPFDKAIFSVAWAGEAESLNWFHIARVYTEKFHHQQQIREATNRPGLLTKQLFYPFIDTFMYGLPHTYRNTTAPNQTVVQIKVTTAIGGEWNIVKTDKGWERIDKIDKTPEAVVILDPETAWKLFTKGISPAQASVSVEIAGDQALGLVALNMISVMA